MIQTTLAAAATALQTEIYVPSVSGVVAGNILFTEREGMKVISVNTANNFVSVQRGYQTGASAHPLGATVYIGSAASFGSVDPSGSVIAGSATPFINLQDGKVWDGSSGTWTLSADPGNGAVPVAVLSKTVTLTDADIKALHATPIQLVAAPGVNKNLHVISGLIVADIPTTGYEWADVLASDPWLYFGLGNVSSSFESTVLNGVNGTGTLFAAAQANNVVRVGPFQRVDNPPQGNLARSCSDNSAEIFNKGLFLILDTDFDTKVGDAANSMKVTVLYTIVDVS